MKVYWLRLKSYRSILLPIAIIIISIVSFAVTRRIQVTPNSSYIPQTSTTVTASRTVMIPISQVQNYCPSIAILRVEYVEYTQPINYSEKAAKIKGKQSEDFSFRDYEVTYKNMNKSPLAALTFCKSADGLGRTNETVYYRFGDSVLPNQEKKEIIRGVGLNNGLSIDVALFEDNSFEGNNIEAADHLIRKWEGAKDGYTKNVNKVNDLILVADGELLDSLRKLRKELLSEIESLPKNVKTRNKEDIRNASRKMGYIDSTQEIIQVISYAEKYVEAKQVDRARTFLQRYLDSLKKRYVSK